MKDSNSFAFARMCQFVTLVQLWHLDVKLPALHVWSRNQNLCYQAFVWKRKLNESIHLGLQPHGPILQISPEPFFFHNRDLKSWEKQSKLISFHRFAPLNYKQELLDPRHSSVMWLWCTLKSLPVQIIQTIGMHLSALPLPFFLLWAEIKYYLKQK